MVVTATISHAVMIDIIYYLHSGKIGNSNASGMLLIYYFIAFSFFAIIMSAIASAYLLSRYDRKISKE